MAGAFNWNGPTPMGLASYVQGQGDYGRQRGEDSRLARLVSGAMSDPSKRQANLAEMASVRPEAAYQAQGQFDQQTDRKYAELGKRAAVLAGAPEAMRGQVWAQLRPELESQFGMTGLPAEVTPEIIQTAQQLAQVYGGLGNDSQLPSSVREAMAFQADSSLLETRKAMYDTYSWGETKDAQGRDVWVPRSNRTAAIGAPGGGTVEVGQPQQVAGNAGAGLMGLVGNGVVMTSGYRDQTDNGRVGGVSNSQHMQGSAGDFAVPQAQKAAFMQRAREAGYEAIDEGDHIHVELPPQGAQAAPGGGTGAQAGGGGFGQSDADRANAAAQKVRAEETMRRQTGLDYASLEADAAAEAARKKKEAELEAERNGKSAVRTASADDLLSLLDSAEALIPQSTGSGAGAAVDSVASFFGGTTSGAEAIAKLKTISGQIVAKMPRMEGPQSDRDVKMYHDMAGDLANPEVPAAQRAAAAAMIRVLNEKYASQQQSAAPAPAASSGGGQTVRLRFNPETGDFE
jgi:hypothetical protein